MRFALGPAAALVVSSITLAACGGATGDIGGARSGVAQEGTLSAQNFNTQKSTVSQEVRFEAFLTGYSYWDNTPPGSAAIAHPVVHQRAGGTGTYDDPITLAVGHRIDGFNRSIDYPVGTRFYFQALRKYAIVEDLCGDGNRPQDGPCHTGRNGRPWLDLYVDGKDNPRQASETCMNRLTRFHTVIQNPAPSYPVVAGALTESGCKVFAG